MFENFPYSNFHDLNTDWIIKKIKSVETSEANAKASEEAAKASEIEARASELSASASAQSAEQSAEIARESATDAQGYAIEAGQTVANTQQQVALLQSRVDNIIPDGTQTEGNTELLDIRVEYDGVIAQSAGDAVRDQISFLKNTLYDSVFDNSVNSYSVFRGQTETYPLGWRVAGISKSSGGLNVNTTNYLVSLGAFFEYPNEYNITPPSGYSIDVFEYTSPSFGVANYVTHYDGVSYFRPDKNKYYRLQIGNFQGAAADFLNQAFLETISIVETKHENKFETLQSQIDNVTDNAEYLGTIGNPLYKLLFSSSPESLAFIEDKKILWCMDDNKMANNNMHLVTFDNGYDAAPTSNIAITHQLGHLNSVDYRNGSLIFGNGGSGNYNGGTAQSPGNGFIYIIEDFMSKFNDHYANNTPMTLNDAITIECDMSDTEFSNDSKFNVIFGESNINRSRDVRNNIIYLVTSTLGQNLYNTKVRRILLGLGSNQLEKGVFITGKGSNEFNGTYKILNTYTGSSDGSDFPNDMVFVNGNIITNVGESGIRIQTLKLNDRTNKIEKLERTYTRYNDDGSLIADNQWSTGICYDNDNQQVTVGFSSSGGLFIYNDNSI